MRGQNDLVGAEGAQRILDRLQGIAVAHLPSRLQSCRCELAQARVKAFLRGRTGVVLV